MTMSPFYDAKELSHYGTPSMVVNVLRVRILSVWQGNFEDIAKD
jgi:hypothetical protein